VEEGVSDDLKAARQAIRDVIVPLKLQCSGYHLDHRLGYAVGDDWEDDREVVFVDVSVTPGEGFPWSEYDDNRWPFKAGATKARDAIRGLLSEVRGTVPEWEALLARDVELAKLVGGRIRAVQAETAFIEAVMVAEYKAHEDVARAEKAARVDVKPGDEFDVTAHEPGKVLVGPGFWVYTWRFDNCTLGPGDKRTPAPHYVVIEP
jgi:hypothetical protein